MQAETLALNTVATPHRAAPTRYLRAAIAVARSPKKGEYAIVYLSAGTFFRTDRLGGLAAQELIRGRSDTAAVELVDRIEPGAGERVRHLSDILNSWSAMTKVPVSRSPWKTGVRRIGSEVAGWALSVLGPLVRRAPTRVLAGLFALIPHTPVARHVWRSNRERILENLHGSGLGSHHEDWFIDVGRRCAVEPPRNYFYMFMGTVLSSDRLARLVESLVAAGAAAELAASVEAAGPMIGAFLHGPLCVAVPNVLRNRGLEVVRVVAPATHGMNVSPRAAPIGDFFGDSAATVVESTDPGGSGTLLRHLKAGRNVYVALDDLAREHAPRASVQFLGRRFLRNDGPAWLCVRSGRPVALWTTYWDSSRLVLKGFPPIYPDLSLPFDRRVAAISERLYSDAEAFILERPGAWGCWNYLNLVTGSLNEVSAKG